MNYFKFIYKALSRRFNENYMTIEGTDCTDRILELKDEEAAAELAVQNMQIKQEIMKIKVVSSDTVAHVRDIEFMPVMSATEVKNPKKKVRKITYTLKTKGGETLYKGTKLRIFIKNSNLNPSFSFSSAYHFANRYQGSRLFKGEYFISFKKSK